MASFDVDQAEGLRRMLSGPKPRVYTFLSSESGEDRSAMLVNVGASLAQAGQDVLLLDARGGAAGVAAHLKAACTATLEQVARRERVLDDIIERMPQGFGVVSLQRAASRKPVTDEQAERITQAFGLLSARADILLVDAELDDEDAFAIPALASSDIVVQVANSPTSIKAAYTIIKRLNSRIGRRPFSILVTGASDSEAKVVYDNMAAAANRYLAVRLNSMGSVPADEHLKRAARLGRAVVDAFPLAGASVAFRRLAGRFVLSNATAAG